MNAIGYDSTWFPLLDAGAFARDFPDVELHGANVFTIRSGTRPSTATVLMSEADYRKMMNFFVPTYPDAALWMSYQASDNQPVNRPSSYRFISPQPHELSAAMGFPKGYKITGNREDQVKQIGNAVEVNQARALAGAAIGKSL